MKNKKIVLFSALVLIIFAAVSLALNIFTPQTQAYSTNSYKQAAEKYLEKNEKAGFPVTIRYNGKYYYYVPAEVRSTISGTFPGIMLDAQTNPVTDQEVLNELYRYPALVKNFSSNVKSFDKLAAKKVASLAEYCHIAEIQKIQADEMNTQANVPGVLYHGVKLAFDTVGLVKAGVGGAASFLKELAKSKVQDAATSAINSADSRAILESSQKAFSSADSAYRACNAALTAWNSVISTTGKASPEYANSATEDLMRLFSHEVTFVEAVKEATERINNYPKLVTKIRKTKYKRGISKLSELIRKLKKEKSYWAREYEDASDVNNLEMWTLEQLDRVGADFVEAVPAQKEPSVSRAFSACTPLDLAQDDTVYNYTIDSPGTNGPCKSFSGSVTSSKVSLTCTTDNRFRMLWVKKVSVSGMDKIKVNAKVAIDDRGFFRSMCPSGGVKYDDYSGLYVLSSDPRPTFNAECNRTVTQEDWPKCAVEQLPNYIIAQCGLEKCSAQKQCGFEVNTAGLDYVYLVFHAKNPWPAYVTGTLSGVEICPAD